MKYINFKRFKFSTIFKNINFKRYKRILADVAEFVISIIEYVFSKIYKSFNLIRHHFLKTYNNINFKKYNFSRIYRYIYIRRYNFIKIYKYFNYKKYKYFFTYLFIFFIFSIFIYLSLPWFFNYDRLNLEKIVCKELNLKCSIKGDIKYSFFPSPRLKLEDFIIKDFANKKHVLAEVENVEVILSIYNLYNKKKFNYTKTKFNNSEINFNLDNLNKYKKFHIKADDFRPIKFIGGNINFIDGKKNITSIKNINFNYISNENKAKGILKGMILNDKINISFINKKKKKNSSKTFILKLLNFGLLAQVDVIDEQTDINKNLSGNFLIKKGKNKLTAIFDYKDDKIIIKHSNIKNFFLDGKMDGEINFLPYFDFDLNVNLNGVNFNRLYNSLVSLDKKDKEKLFKINKKINGNLSLSVDKIFSKYTIINSIESRIKFINGNIFIEQALLSLGKIGAADIEGRIINDNKFSNFKFENNIFIDNLKRFYNKFGIYGKNNIPYSIFISGNFDLINLILRISEISDDKNFKSADVAYIEKEFNNIVMEEGYVSLFNFHKLKKFIQLVTYETD